MYLKRLALIVAVALLGSAASAIRADVLEQILVKVNGDIFTKTELEARQVAALRQRSQNISDAELLKLKKAVQTYSVGDILEIT